MNLNPDKINILVAAVFGMLVGQLSVGIPMGRALTRRRPPRWPDGYAEASVVMVDEWPRDAVARQLAEWPARIVPSRKETPHANPTR